MKNNIKVLEGPETSMYVAYGQATTSQYITYRSSSSLIPNSFDQIIKNRIFFIPAVERDFLVNDSAGKPF